MKKKLFGTDGIRGIANQGVMSAEIAMKVGIAAGHIFTRGDHRHRVIIGKDTRLSGYLIEPALTSGFIAAGMDVILVGPMPTPGIAMLTRTMRADLGVMISASHNPYYDNGIKIFGPDGRKLSDQIENLITDITYSDNLEPYLVSDPSKLGRAKRLNDAVGRYIEFIKNTFPKDQNLEGLKIVVDCANGAAYQIAGLIFKELGADVIELSISPNGLNINDQCGALHTENLKETILKHNADIGIALDGDGDRLIIVDEKGESVDGDQIIAAIAKFFKENNRLNNNKVVTTVMSNLALEEYLSSISVDLVRTDVGDRNVSETMQKLAANLGGEQSGHIILGDYNTTGDGLVAALQILAILISRKDTASKVFNSYKPMPQILKNVKCINENSLELNQIKNAIRAAERELDGNGRLLIRRSGTEPLIRILVESKNQLTIEKIANDLISQFNLV